MNLHLFTLNLHTLHLTHTITENTPNETHVIDQLDLIDYTLVLLTVDPSTSDLELIKQGMKVEAFRILSKEYEYHSDKTNNVRSRIEKLSKELI